MATNKMQSNADSRQIIVDITAKPPVSNLCAATSRMLMQEDGDANPRHTKCSEHCVYADDDDSDSPQSPILGPFSGSWKGAAHFKESQPEKDGFETSPVAKASGKQPTDASPTPQQLASFSDRMRELTLAHAEPEPQLKTVKKLPVVYAWIEPLMPMKAEMCDASADQFPAVSSSTEPLKPSTTEVSEASLSELPVVYAYIRPLPSSTGSRQTLRRTSADISESKQKISQKRGDEA